MAWAWLLRGRTIVAICVLGFALAAWGRMSYLSRLSDERQQEIVRLQAEIAQRDSVAKAVANMAAQREQAARDAVAAALARARKAEAAMQDLHANRPDTGDPCRNAELILRRYREGAR